MIRSEPHRSFYVLAYDVGDNKRRRKLSKLLESMGLRVQGSVFEGWLSAHDLKTLRETAGKILRAAEDSLRVYCICEECRAKILLIGQSPETAAPATVIL